MTNIPKGFWQADLPPPLPSIQLARDRYVHLDRNCAQWGDKWFNLTPQEAKMLFILIEKWRVSPGGIVPTWYLVEQVLSYRGDKPEHALETVASKIRDKLGDKRSRRYIVRVHGVGYKLCPDEGFGTITY